MTINFGDENKEVFEFDGKQEDPKIHPGDSNFSCSHQDPTFNTLAWFSKRNSRGCPFAVKDIYFIVYIII